jgi:hypothetical protein
MIIHCTKKLATRFPIVHSEALTETSPLGSWHANLYTFDRRQCLLFTHDETRYSLFFPGVIKPMFDNFDEVFKGLFLGSLFFLGVPDNQLSRVELAMGKMTFDVNTDRSVLSTMNNHKHMVHARVVEEENVMDMDILALNYWLSDMFVSTKTHPDYWVPNRKMKDFVASL